MDFVQTFYDKHTKTWSGSKKYPFYDFDVSIGQILFSTMKYYPKNVTQISDIDGKSLTNHEAITWAIRLAQKFKKMGLRHDDIIGISCRNTTYTMPLAVGCFMNCTPFHGVNPIFDEKTFTHLFGITKPKVIFCDGSEYEKIRRATEAFKPLIYTLIDHIEGVPNVEDLLEPTKTEMLYRPEKLLLGGDQTTAILCSSGTTGMPKAVCLSNYKMFFDTPIGTSEDVLYTSSGIDWTSGLNMMTTCSIRSCKRIITNKPYSPEYFVELVKKYQVTIALVAPRHIAALLTCPTATTANLSSIKLMAIGGGCVSLPTLARIQDILKGASITCGYGLTEAGSVSASYGLLAGNSVGKLSSGYRVRIVDENGKSVGPKEVGEIIVHNGRNWNGYYGNPVETQKIQDSLGWFHTGDLGYFDEKNFLYVVDRKKDILKYQGMHYWAAEIEDAIAELPQVTDVAVVGVYDERNGDAAGAVVVRAKGSNLTVQDIKDHVAKRMTATYKQLHAGVIFVDELPVNGNGKTMKNDVKALFKTAQG